MVKTKIMGYRFIIAVLFFLALIATAEAATGLDAKAISKYILIDGGSPSSEGSIGHRKKEASLSLKSIYRSASNFTYKPYQASARKVPSLEEEMDWSIYPVKSVTATGYTAGIESTGKLPGHPTYGITYSGVKVKRDLYSTIAADPSVFPIGTILFIPKYGYGVVADTGSAIKGDKIDLYYETVDDVYNEWGKQQVDVYVVKMGMGRLSEEELVALNEDEAMQVFRTTYLKSENE